MIECMALPFSIGLIVLGLLTVFNKDFAWKWQEDSNKMRGLVSERTDDWERSSTLVGVMLLICGGLILIIALSGSL